MSAAEAHHENSHRHVSAIQQPHEILSDLLAPGRRSAKHKYLPPLIEPINDGRHGQDHSCLALRGGDGDGRKSSGKLDVDAGLGTTRNGQLDDRGRTRCSESNGADHYLYRPVVFSDRFGYHAEYDVRSNLIVLYSNAQRRSTIRRMKYRHTGSIRACRGARHVDELPAFVYVIINRTEGQVNGRRGRAGRDYETRHRDPVRRRTM